MMRILHYYSRFQQARGGFGGLPGWARAVLILLAIPGLLLAVLSIVLLGVSILALLLLTMPAYRLLAWTTGASGGDGGEMMEAEVVSRESADSPRRPIEVKILQP